MSTSQNDFFKMLDDKVESGPDYVPTGEFEFALEREKLNQMLQEWQAAKHKSKYQTKMQRYHSVQSNGEPPGMRPRLSHQTSLYTTPPPQAQYSFPPSHYDPYHQARHYQPPPQHIYQPPPAHHYTSQNYQTPPQNYQTPPQNYQTPPQYAPPPQQPPMYAQQPPYHHHIGASSVVMYDKRGGYYTELA